MRTDITLGQTSDCLGFELLMVDNLPEPQVLIADPGYDADRIRKTMSECDILTQIAMQKTRKMRIGVDHGLYRLRNMVELVASTISRMPVASPLDTTKPQKATSRLSTLHQSAFGCDICQHDLGELPDREDTVEKLGVRARAINGSK